MRHRSRLPIPILPISLGCRSVTRKRCGTSLPIQVPWSWCPTKTGWCSARGRPHRTLQTANTGSACFPTVCQAVQLWDTTNVNALTGEATYSGDAAGVYVDRPHVWALHRPRDAHGGDFTGPPSMLSGRIDNFKNTGGTYLGTDTAANPNDPVGGGENDWVVVLLDTAINTEGTFAPNGNGMVAGSADGVAWTDGGEWSAQLYGPGDGGRGRGATEAERRGRAVPCRVRCGRGDPGVRQCARRARHPAHKSRCRGVRRANARYELTDRENRATWGGLRAALFFLPSSTFFEIPR